MAISLKSILSGTLEDVNKYNKKELKNVVETMEKEVAKRRERLENFEKKTRYTYNGKEFAGSVSPALYYLNNTSTSTDKDNLNKLRNIYKVYYKFLTNPTSLVSVWQEERKQLKNNFKEYTQSKMNSYKIIDMFFNTYNKIMETGIGDSLKQTLSSSQAFREAAQSFYAIFKKSSDYDEIFIEFEKRMEELYNEGQDFYNRYK